MRLTDYFREFLLRRRLFEPRELAPVIDANRASLGSVSRWIHPATYESSLFGYGVPERERGKLDHPINGEPTYADVMVLLAGRLRAPVHYLEIGVSAGKTFYQMAHAVKHGKLAGFDIEEINPVLAALLERGEAACTATGWPTMGDSIKKSPSSMTQWRFGTNELCYLNGDIWDAASWKRLHGQQFNVILSDALHDPEALLFEFRMLRELELIDTREFVLVWDDLGGSMTEAFLRIWKELKQQLALPPSSVALNRYNGWLGEHERRHLCGFITHFAS